MARQNQSQQNNDPLPEEPTMIEVYEQLSASPDRLKSVLQERVTLEPWFCKSIPGVQERILQKVADFAELPWVKEGLSDEQRYQCFLTYLQHEFLRQGLRPSALTDRVDFDGSIVGATTNSISMPSSAKLRSS